MCVRCEWRARIRIKEGWKNVCVTYVLRTSPKTHIPSTAPATPRTALETMWVIGEVTLIDSRLAKLIKKPSTPYIPALVADNEIKL
jgi:hypothetical protein